MILNYPKNQTAEVLHELLTKEKIKFSEIHRDTGIINLSARLSQLKLDYGLPIECVIIKTKNKFGRSIRYGSWVLRNKVLGRIVYSKINVK